MVCLEDCFVLLNSFCNLTAIANSDEEECSDTVNCLNYYTYGAISLVGALILQVIILTTSMLCCCKRIWMKKKIGIIHRKRTAGIIRHNMHVARLPIAL